MKWIVVNQPIKNTLGVLPLFSSVHRDFEQENMPKVTPRTPDVLNKIRLPELDFVEVYNQPPRLEEVDGDGSVSGRHSRHFSRDLCTLFDVYLICFWLLAGTFFLSFPFLFVS